MSKRDNGLMLNRHTQGDLGDLWGREAKLRERKAQPSPLIVGDDGLIAERVNGQTKEKHKCLTDFIKLSRGARSRFLGSGHAGATYIDLFSGTGRAQVIGSGEWVDGSAVAAWKASLDAKTPFSRIFIADIDEKRRSACATRLQGLGAPVVEIPGPAADAVKVVLNKVNRFGLHLAFLDPYTLEALDFSIIRALSALRHPDVLMHVSAMDLQRNVGVNIASPLWDAFAPGWRTKIDFTKSRAEIRRQLVLYWQRLVAELGVWPAKNMRLITGERRQRLYWLLLAAKNDLAHKLWQVASNPQGQKPLPLIGGGPRKS